MGLDMYLNAGRWMRTFDPAHDDSRVASAIKALFPEAEALGAVKTVSMQAAYWRKANAIHQWFVTNVQDGVDECQEHSVSREQIADLIATCNIVLGDHSRAAELLPTQEGFFFGGTEYDAYYFRDLEDTVRMLTPLLAPAMNAWDYTYRSSW